MSNTKHRFRRSESPFVWQQTDDDDPALPWWTALKPDWWAGSTEYVLKRSLNLFAQGIRSVVPGAGEVLQNVAKLISTDDLRPLQIEDLEADIAAGVELGQLPDMALQLLWDSFSWGLPEWAPPASLTLSEFQDHMKEHLKRDIMGLDTENQ